MKQVAKLSPIRVQEGVNREHLAQQSGWQVIQRFLPVEDEVRAAHKHIAICDQTQRGKLRIEGQEAVAMLSAADLAIHGGKKMDMGYLFRLRRDLFYYSVNAKDEQVVQQQLLDKLQNAGSLITITNITHGNGEIWLVGPKSSELLSRLCSLDFHDSQFPDLTAKQSSVAKTKQLLIRRDIGDTPAYALIGDRSLANYLWHTMMSAGKDLQIQCIGQQAFEQLMEGE